MPSPDSTPVPPAFRLHSTPGSVLFVAGTGWEDTFIRWSQRHSGTARRWTHCALVISPDTIIEAKRGGVVRSPLASYSAHETAILSPPLTETQRALAVQTAQACQREEYGLFDALDCGLRLVTGLSLPWHDADSQFCSELVAGALNAAGMRLPATPSPAELYLLLR